MIGLYRLDAVAESPYMLGVFFAANEIERKRYTRAVWRCSKRGHVLGFTLDVDGETVLLSAGESRKMMRHPLFQWGDTDLTPEALKAVDLATFIDLVTAGDITREDCLALVPKISTKSRLSWFSAYWGDTTPPIAVGCSCGWGFYPAGELFDGKKKVLVNIEDLTTRPEH